MLIILTEFLWGACLASFITTMVSRHLLSKSRTYPAYSICDTCRQRLAFWQLIPIIGWLIQRGRCWWCHSWISPFQTVTEIFCGWLYFLFLPLSWQTLLLTTILVCGLLVLATTDWYEQWIYPTILPTLIPLAILVPHPHIWLFDLLIALLFLIIGFSPGIGLGDGEFLFLLTICLGSQAACLTILFACALSLTNRRLWQKQALPLISYLVGGLILTITLINFGWVI